MRYSKKQREAAREFCLHYTYTATEMKKILKKTSDVYKAAISASREKTKIDENKNKYE